MASQVGSPGDPGGSEKSLQNGSLSDLIGHLCQTEGLHAAGVACGTESRWKRGHSGSRCLGHESWGQVLGTGQALRQESGVAQVVADVARGLSMSTNSSMESGSSPARSAAAKCSISRGRPSACWKPKNSSRSEERRVGKER